MNYDLQRCRLCALPILSNSLIPFGNSIYEPMIAKLKIFGLHIKQDDGLPDCICNGCTGILSTFIQTMELFLQADKKLRTILQENENNKSIEINESETTKTHKVEQTKRKGEDVDLEIIECKRKRRFVRLNLLRNKQSDSNNIERKEINLGDSECLGKKSKFTMQQSESIKFLKSKKHERKENLKFNVRNEIIDTEINQNCMENMEDLGNDKLNYTEAENDHVYFIRNQDETETMKLTGEAQVEKLNTSNDVSETINSQTPDQIKLIPAHNVCLVAPINDSNAPSVYTQPKNDKEIDVFTCLDCSQLFWNREKTLEHAFKLHAQGALTYKARYMVKRIKCAKAYNSHKHIICTLCFVSFQQNDEFIKHLTEHHFEIYKCPHCKQCYSTKNGLLKHKETHRDEIVICEICNVSHPMEEYARHKQTHSLYVHFQQVCEKNKLKKLDRLKGSGQIVAPEENVELINEDSNPILNINDIVSSDEIICGGSDDNHGKEDLQTAQYSNDDKFLKRTKKTLESKSLDSETINSNVYKCIECLSSFKNRYSILKHIQKIHSVIWMNKNDFVRARKLKFNTDNTDNTEGELIFLCRICTTDCDSENEYFTHLETFHHCKYCKKTFLLKEEMNNHMNSHRKPYRCDMCDASFYVEKNFLDHKLTHSHKCNFCDASFRSETSLANHKISSHMKSSCPVCFKQFDNDDKLEEHFKVHQQRKKYYPCLCELCGKSYNNPTRFKAHLQSHSEDGESSCQFCSMSFNNALKLKRHLRFSHLEAYTQSLGMTAD